MCKIHGKNGGNLVVSPKLDGAVTEEQWGLRRIDWVGSDLDLDAKGVKNRAGLDF